MKPISRSMRKTFAPVRLYRDDLEAVWGQLGTLGTPYAEVPGYRAESIDALSQHFGDGAIHDLTLAVAPSGMGSYVSVSLSPSETMVYSGSDDPAYHSAFVRISDVMRERRRRLSSWSAFLASYVGLLLLLLFAIPALPSEARATTGIGVGVIWATVLASWLVSHTYRHSTVVLKRRGDASPSAFFRLHRGELILIVVTAIVTAVVSVAGTLLTQALTN